MIIHACERQATEFLSERPEVEVVGQELSGAAALEKAPLARPDVILMDLEMPGMNGLEATQRLKEQAARPLIVIVTLHDAQRFRAAAAKAGADGFVTKQRLPTELLPLLQGLMAEQNKAQG